MNKHSNLFGCIVTWAASICLVVSGPICWCFADDMRPISLQRSITNVQPMTGIVLWTTNDSVEKMPIQLEYSYMTYAQIVEQKGVYDWSALEKILDEVASRGHQLVLRWHDTYVGKPTGIPQYLVERPGYKLTVGKSEKKRTEFPDWSNLELRSFVLEFFTRFCEKYDRDPRLSFVQVGFGLWAEYHIYDGPMQLGLTFPSKEYQSEFAQHLTKCFRETPWMISVDAADSDRSPFVENKSLSSLQFGLFDDSFNHARHRQENEPNWDAFGRDRWKSAPMGGEFSFFQKVDQSKALAPNGPHGIAFEKHAADFHVSFIIGDDQPRFQKADRIRAAGIACGYRFQIDKFESSNSESQVTISNTGIAPIYYDAWPSINGARATDSLKGLLPGENRLYVIQAGGSDPELKIECDRLVKGQQIEFDAELP